MVSRVSGAPFQRMVVKAAPSSFYEMILIYPSHLRFGFSSLEGPSQETLSSICDFSCVCEELDMCWEDEKGGLHGVIKSPGPVSNWISLCDVPVY